MSIRDLPEKVKPFYTILLILVIGSIFFALGRLSSLEERHTPIRVEYPARTQTGAVVEAEANQNTTPAIENNALTNTTDSSGGGAVIGSKSGKKYYFPWCGTIKRVKPENQVPFASIADARKAGYLPAKNCKGLQ